jgi:hypothetical protein
MDGDIGARLEDARRRIDLLAGWMDRQTRLLAERVKGVVERLEGLERELCRDRLRLRPQPVRSR